MRKQATHVPCVMERQYVPDASVFGTHVYEPPATPAFASQICMISTETKKKLTSNRHDRLECFWVPLHQLNGNRLMRVTHMLAIMNPFVNEKEKQECNSYVVITRPSKLLRLTDSDAVEGVVCECDGLDADG